MSVIACRIHDGKVYIAADSMGAQSEIRVDRSLKIRKLHKINGSIIVGWAGTYEEGNMFVYCLQDSDVIHQEEKPLSEFMSNFYKMRDQKFPYPKERETASDCQYILIVAGKPFYISQGMVTEIRGEQFFSIGCGCDIAMAAMDMGALPKEAVSIACKYSAFCAPPIISYEVDYYDRKSKRKEAELS